MCIIVVEADPSNLGNVLDLLKTREMCNKAVKGDSFSLQYVPDWFVTREGTYMWHDDSYDDDGDYWVAGDDDGKFFKWYEGYKKRKVQKAKVKEEHLPIVWHPSRWRD